MDQQALDRLAELAVDFAANVQPGQIVTTEAETGMEPIVRAVAARAYDRGARFVDPIFFDPYVKKARLERAPEELEVINKRLVNWTILPYPTRPWAELVYPDLDSDAALERLGEELAHVCRLDEDDPVAAWQERKETLHSAAGRLSERHFDSVRFQGPGTDLTIGLLPTSIWEGGSTTTVDDVEHMPNVPTEEVYTTPDPTRAEGVVRATKPLDVAGTIIDGLEVRFEGGRAVDIQAERGGDLLRERAAHDADASRLGEVALVDREGRIGRLGTTFYNTLLDENAASHIALGNAYEVTVGAEDVDKINRSAIHIDFMIGGDDVDVTGTTREGDEVPVLRGGSWQI